MNPAQRILNVAIAVKARTQPQDKCLPAWMAICSSLYGDSREVNQHRITSIFAALNEEADLLIEELEEKKLPEHIYAPYLDQFRATLQPTWLAGAWSSCANQLNQESVHIFHWIALYLGEQEELIQQEDLDELITSLRGIDALIAEPSLPRALKRIIKNNIDAIWNAIDTYPIRGAAGLEEAIKRAAGDLTFNHSEIVSALNSDDETTRTATSALLSTVKKTVAVFNGTVKVSENIIKVGGAIHELLKLP